MILTFNKLVLFVGVQQNDFGADLDFCAEFVSVGDLLAEEHP